MNFRLLLKKAKSCYNTVLTFYNTWRIFKFFPKSHSDAYLPKQPMQKKCLRSFQHSSNCKKKPIFWRPSNMAFISYKNSLFSNLEIVGWKKPILFFSLKAFMTVKKAKRVFLSVLFTWKSNQKVTLKINYSKSGSTVFCLWAFLLESDLFGETNLRLIETFF